jgi:hypothetical protein
MEMILLDWTRMAKSYCLAGAVVEQGQVRIVRPLWAKYREAPVRNVGWSAYLLDGHCRWEILELIGPAAAAPEPPHLEDVWVRDLKARRKLAPPDLRRAILQATLAPPGEPLFGTPLVTNRTAACLPPNTGRRSLTSVMVPAGQIRFGAWWREGTPEADVRVTLPLPEVGPRTLPVKDHHFLRQAEQGPAGLEQRLQVLYQALVRMGDPIVVRLGLSRPFVGHGSPAQAECWLMADGFFSLTDPQS